MGKLLTKEQILEAEDIVVERVKVPEWGGELFIKTMTGTERDEFETIILDEKKKERNVRAALLSMCIVDENKARMFSGPDAIVALGNKSGKALERCFKVAQRLSKLSDKDVAELEDFSEPTLDSDITSPSQSD